MIVAKTPLKSSPRWLQLAAAALAALTLPLGVTYAQNTDVRAVAERLERAVKAGEMSKADMDAVLRSLKQSTQKRQQGRKKKGGASDAQDEAKRMIEQVNRRARAAYESGKMTGEEARKFARERIAEIEARMKKGAGAERGRDGAAQKMRAEHEAMVKKLREAVANGELSAEDMKRKVAAHRRAIGEKMKAAEKKGAAEKMRRGAAKSREAAEKKAAKGRKAADLPRVSDAFKDKSEEAERRYAEALERFTEAVKSGEMTKAEATEKWEAMQKQRGGKEKKAAKKAGPSPEMVWQRIERAVKNGDLTEEEAKQRYMEWEKRYGSEKEAKKARDVSGKERLERMRKRLDAAVERGDMTKKEAKQKWAELRKQMGADKKAGKQRAKRKKAPAEKSKKRDGDR